MSTDPDQGSGAVATQASVFWPTVWTVIALLAVKATYVQLSSFWKWATRPRDYASWNYFRWATAATQSDVLFALGLGLLAAAGLFALRRHPRAVKTVSAVFFFASFLAVALAVPGRQVFAYYHAPVTYQLLSLTGDPRQLRSSIAEYMTVPVVIALIAVPAVYALLCWGAPRLESRWRPGARRWMRASLGVLVLGWLITGLQLKGTGWFRAQDAHMTDSPHWTLIASYFGSVLGTRTSLSGVKVRPEDLTDFAPSGTAARNAAYHATGARPRNVILVVLESVGSRYLGIYGSGLDTTPRLAAEQANALVFDHYYAPVAWTAYSLVALTLSRRPPMEAYNQTTFHTNLQGETLASSLEHRGYRTAFLAAGNPDWASAGALEKNGFSQVIKGERLPGARRISSWGTKDGSLFDAMLQWIDSNRQQPFFVMAWTDQTHNPYKLASDQPVLSLVPSKEPDRKKDALSRYTTLIRAADSNLGLLFDALRKSGLADDTLVVVTGDHGEAFGSLHGGGGHGFTVFDEEVQVPLFIWNPRLFHQSGRSAVIGSHPDLAPTVLDLLGIEPPAGWHGRSLFDPQKPPRTYLFAAAWGKYLLGVREENWKYIFDARSGGEELYDLSADQEEQHDVAAANQDRARRMQQRLAAWLQVDRQDR